MKKYEAVFILDIRKTDDEGEGFSRSFGALIESLGGKMLSTVPMGRKQFSYDIKKRKAGVYWNFFFELDPDKILAIKEKYHLDETVLRNLIIVSERPENLPTEEISLNMG